jgi:hypothetical protein
MNIYSKLYWLTRLDGIQGLFVAIAIIIFVGCVAIFIWKFASEDFDEFCEEEEIEIRKKQRKSMFGKIKWMMPLGFVFLLLSILTPTKNEAIFIVAGGKTIDWIQNDTSICKIPSQTTAIISDFLDNQIKKMGEKQK